jgi:hypothetical protein
MNEEKKPMTIEDLAQEMRAGFNAAREFSQQGFEMLNAKIDMIDENKPDKGDVDSKFEKMMEVINERTFTPDEKESMLGVARFIDKRLEEEARGENNIPLTRPEYDAVVEEVGLPNRFIGGLKTQQA